jgi:hypothetical protein
MDPYLLTFGAIGLTIVVTKSKIFMPLRRSLVESRQIDVALLGELLSCSMCLGTWMGFVVGLLLGYGLVGVLAYGGVVCVGAWFACGVCCLLELLIERLRMM